MVRTPRLTGDDRWPLVAYGEVHQLTRGNHGWILISSSAIGWRRVTSHATKRIILIASDATRWRQLTSWATILRQITSPATRCRRWRRARRCGDAVWNPAHVSGICRRERRNCASTLWRAARYDRTLGSGCSRSDLDQSFDPAAPWDPCESPASGFSSLILGPAAEAATADRASNELIPGSSRQVYMRLKRHVTRWDKPPA